MAELLRNAYTGWFRITDHGKMMALFLTALLFLWWNREKEEQKRLLYYGTASAVCCILPVTAAVLMLYQTRFYDYEWIWSIVPVTVVTAYAGTKLLRESWQGFRLKSWRRGLPVTVGILLTALLCSPVDRIDSMLEEKEQQKENAAQLLADLERNSVTDISDAKICLWAPREIMEYARGLDGDILLPYGRNMWEESLDAYTYDSYSEEVEEMYRWMCMAEKRDVDGKLFQEASDVQGEETAVLSTKVCLETARKEGVTLLVLPQDIDQALLNEVTGFVGAQPERIMEYYLFSL